MIPHRTPFFLPLLYPTLIWRMDPSEKSIYLTFDDGPVPGPTEFVLQTLDTFNIKATFFCIGNNIHKHTLLFNEIIKAGHAIGNHTFNHLSGWKTDTHTYIENVKQCNVQIEDNNKGNTQSNIFRPPYGRVTRNQINKLTSYKIIMWDVLSGDYRSELKPEACLKKTVDATRNGSIIVFHDSYKAEKNLIYALPRFVDSCLKKEYVFKTLK